MNELPKISPKSLKNIAGGEVRGEVQQEEVSIRRSTARDLLIQRLFILLVPRAYSLQLQQDLTLLDNTWQVNLCVMNPVPTTPAVPGGRARVLLRIRHRVAPPALVVPRHLLRQRVYAILGFRAVFHVSEMPSLWSLTRLQPLLRQRPLRVHASLGFRVLFQVSKMPGLWPLTRL